MADFDKYKSEVTEKWGQTEAYREYTQLTKEYTGGKWDALAEGLEGIMAEFALCMKNGASPDSKASQDLVKLLQRYITGNYYRCTNEILAGLGQMYVADERIKSNIDKHAEGTADFICAAITNYCQY